MSSPAAGQHEAVIPVWSLGDRLRKIRRLSGLSQAEIAERLQTNQKTYAAWELDASAPRNLVAVAKRVEAFSGVPWTWILDGEPPTAHPTGRYPVGPSGTTEGLAPVIDLRPGYRHGATCNGSSRPVAVYAPTPSGNVPTGRVHDAHAA
jgi:transcriptional regulator with XRE-family HTH domain